MMGRKAGMQVLVSVMSTVIVMLAICTGILPNVLRVTVWAGLVVPTACVPKLRVVGEI
jgi:hypothetical protein